MSSLFTPLRLNSTHVLKNRLVVAPMTTTQSHPDGTISSEEADWLERLAADGYGMVITCAAAISKDSIAFENQLSLERDTMIKGLETLTKRMQGYDCLRIVQLCHGGSRAIKAQPYSASSYPMPAIPGFVPPKMLSESQIDRIIADFAQACQRAEKAGFDGVEMHGANGYLFTQFISSMSNLRNDMYGGSLENRARFSREVVRACRSMVSEEFIIGFRMSFENFGLETGLDIDETIQNINWLVEEGIDYAHISSLDYTSKSIKYPDQIALNYIRRNITSELPLIGVGGITSYQKAHQAIEHGADLVAIGRASIGNKELPKIFAKEKDLLHQNPFTEDSLTNLGISFNFRGYLRKWPVSTLNVIQ